MDKKKTVKPSGFPPFDGILDDLFGPMEKLESLSRILIDASNTFEVNKIGLGAMLRDIHLDFARIARQYRKRPGKNQKSTGN